MSIIVFQHTERSLPGRLGTILRDYGHRLDVRKLHDGDTVPDSFEGVDGVVSLGGAMNVADIDDYPWMSQELAFIREAHERDLPVIGLCLGCQLIAAALGGEVDHLPEGKMEIGFHEVSSTNAGMFDTVFSGIPWRMMQFHWHGCHVSKPPSGASVLSSSALTPVQAFRIGLRTYGFQFHFEATAELAEVWAKASPGELERVGLTRDSLRAQFEQHGEPFARLSSRLAQSISEYLVPAAQDRVL